MFEQAAGELRAKLLRRQQDPSQTNFACNSIGPNFNKPRKRCNSNDANSIFEQAAGELHAKVMIDSQNWATCSNPRPGRTTSRRAEPKARGADGSRAGRRPRARQAARPHNRVPHRPEHQRRHQHRRNTGGATHYRGIAKPPGPTGAGRLTQYQRIIEESRQYRDYRDRFPGARSRCRASRRCPWRCLPSGDPRRRR